MSIPKVLQHLTIADSTHLLACVHAVGHRTKNYKMHCILLNEAKPGRVRVLVFGRLYWKNQESVKSIRYVDKDKLTLLKLNK